MQKIFFNIAFYRQQSNHQETLIHSLSKSDFNYGKHKYGEKTKHVFSKHKYGEKIKPWNKEYRNKIKMEKKRSLEVGLFKKTGELCVLCDAEAAIIIFSPSRRAFVFGHLWPLLYEHYYQSLPPSRYQLSCTSSSEDDTGPTNFSSPFPLSSSLIF